MSNHTTSFSYAIPATRTVAGVLEVLCRPVNLFFIVVAAVLAYLSLYPTFFLFLGSLRDAPLGVAGSFTLTNYSEAYFQEPAETFALLLNSLIFAAGSSTFSIVIAIVLAWIAIRTNAPLRGLFELTAILPNVVPALLVSMSWVLLLNPTNGIVNVILEGLFGFKPFNIYSMGGLIWVEGMVTAPLAFLLIAAALRSMDPALEESAKTLGSTEIGLTWRITFPLMRPAILAAWTLNFVRAIESFDTPSIIALPAGIDVFTTKIFREALESFPSNDNLAAAYGVGLLFIALLFVTFYRRMTAKVERYTTVTGKGFRPHTIDLGKWKGLASGAALIMLFFMVVVPLLTLLLISLLPYYHTPTWGTFQKLTLKHWVDLYHQERVVKAVWASVRLAVFGATACIFFASCIAYLTVKTKIAGRSILDGLAFIPWAFPGTAMALGLLWAYVKFPLPIYNTLWIIGIAYVTRFLPFALRATSSTIIQIHTELEEASVACGAGFIATFRRILIPLMRPGILAGWILLTTIFMREFSASLFLSSAENEPIGPLLFWLYQDGSFGTVAALGIVISAISTGLVLLARRYARLEAE